MAYKGPATFPVIRTLRKTRMGGDLILEDHRHDEAIAALKAAFDAAQGSLRDRYAQRVGGVRWASISTPFSSQR